MACFVVSIRNFSVICGVTISRGHLLGELGNNLEKCGVLTLSPGEHGILKIVCLLCKRQVRWRRSGLSYKP
jgi:hypothetical protein